VTVRSRDESAIDVFRVKSLSYLAHTTSLKAEEESGFVFEHVLQEDSDFRDSGQSSDELISLSCWQNINPECPRHCVRICIR